MDDVGGVRLLDSVLMLLKPPVGDGNSLAVALAT